MWLLGSLCALHRQPFDATLVAQEFPPPYTPATLHEAARSLGFKTGDAELAAVDWRALPLPAVAFLRPVPVEPASGDASAEAAGAATAAPVAHAARAVPVPPALSAAEPAGSRRVALPERACSRSRRWSAC